MPQPAASKNLSRWSFTDSPVDRVAQGAWQDTSARTFGRVQQRPGIRPSTGITGALRGGFTFRPPQTLCLFRQTRRSGSTLLESGLRSDVDRCLANCPSAWKFCRGSPFMRSDSGTTTLTFRAPYCQMIERAHSSIEDSHVRQK